MTLLVGSIFHMTRKIVSEMTYNVSMGTLNPTIPTIPYYPCGKFGICSFRRFQMKMIAILTRLQSA